ncbi:MAG: hypothetical protein WDM94_09415 [Bauldia sp.]
MTIPRTVMVSDHALLRYLERVKGVDIESARAEVIAITGVAAALGAPTAVRDGHAYVIKNYTVTTVLPKGGRPSRQSRPSPEPYAVAKGGRHP